MKIQEITEGIVTRQTIIDAMMAKKWPQELQAEMADEWVLKQPSQNGLDFVNGLDLQSAVPQTVSTQTLLQNAENKNNVARTPQKVVDIINQRWNTDFKSDPEKQFDPNPQRYAKYMQMSAVTAKPSILVDGEIVMGIGRFIAALMRGDRQLKVWNVKRNNRAKI